MRVDRGDAGPPRPLLRVSTLRTDSLPVQAGPAGDSKVDATAVLLPIPVADRIRSVPPADFAHARFDTPAGDAPGVGSTSGQRAPGFAGLCFRWSGPEASLVVEGHLLFAHCLNAIIVPFHAVKDNHRQLRPHSGYGLTHYPFAEFEADAMTGKDGPP